MRVLAMALILTAFLGGCTMTDSAPQLTAAALRQQMLDYLTETMKATGHPDDWWLGTKDVLQVPWIPEEQEFVSGWCTGGGTDGAREYEQYVSHDPDSDSVALAERVVDRWLELGYPVSLVSSPSTKPGVTRITEYRADLINGVRLGLFSSDDLIDIHIRSSCSTDPSMYHLDPS